MPPQGDHHELKRLLEENQELLKENNRLLRKLYRHNIIGFLFTFLWYGFLIGFPFLLYFYVIEPYFEAFGSNYEVFRAGINEIPGLKGLERLLP